LENILKNEEESSHLTFECAVFAIGQTIRTNTLTITREQWQKNALINELFGDASSVHVSRDQINEFSSEVYKSFNILEDYQVPESQFKESFVEDFIKQTSAFVFKYVDFDTVMKDRSPYNISKDLKPDVIKKT